MRIRFLKDLYEEACGDHPLLVHARKGQLGVLLDGRCAEGNRVNADGRPDEAWFGATYGEEFEIVPDVPVGVCVFEHLGSQGVVGQTVGADGAGIYATVLYSEEAMAAYADRIRTANRVRNARMIEAEHVMEWRL